MSRTTPEEIVRKYWQAWSDHDLDALMDLLAPDFVSRSSLSQGRAVSRQALASGFRMFDKALPDLREEVVTVVTQGDRVACEVVETATFKRPLDLMTRTIQPTNRSYRLAVASFFHVNAEGLISEQHSYWDTANWSRQVGIDPETFAPDAEP